MENYIKEIDDEDKEYQDFRIEVLKEYSQLEPAKLLEEKRRLRFKQYLYEHVEMQDVGSKVVSFIALAISLFVAMIPKDIPMTGVLGIGVKIFIGVVISSAIIGLAWWCLEDANMEYGRMDICIQCEIAIDCIDEILLALEKNNQNSEYDMTQNSACAARRFIVEVRERQ